MKLFLLIILFFTCSITFADDNPPLLNDDFFQSTKKWTRSEIADSSKSQASNASTATSATAPTSVAPTNVAAHPFDDLNIPKEAITVVDHSNQTAVGGASNVNNGNIAVPLNQPAPTVINPKEVPVTTAGQTQDKMPIQTIKALPSNLNLNTNTANVTNLSPNNTVAPYQTLPSVNSIDSQQPQSKEIKPVILKKQKEDDKVSDAISLIVNSDSKKVTDQKLSKATRKVYDYKKQKIDPILHQQLTRNFFKAIAAGNTGAVQTILEQGVDIEARLTEREMTPLLFAVSKSEDAIARLLLAHGADVNATTTDGKNALHIAALANDLGLINLLLEFKAPLFERDHNDKIPFEYLEASLREKATHIMARTCEQKQSCMLYATMLGSVNAVKFLLRNGADVNSTNSEGDTPLIMSMKTSDANMANFLLTQGADPRIANQSGKKAIDYAVEADNLKLAHILDTVAIRMDLDQQ